MATIRSSVWYVNWGNGTSTGYYAIPKWATATTYTVGQIVRPLTAPSAANERAYICTVPGLSVTEPTWTFTKGAIDAGTVESFQECTGQPWVNGDQTNTPVWTASSTWVQGQIIFNAAKTGVFICKVGGAGSGSQPAGLTTPVLGAVTTDTSASWTCIQASGSAATQWGAPFSWSANVFAATWGAAGDIFYLNSAHQETQAAAVTWAVPGTAAAPCQILCVGSTNTPPQGTDQTTGASITTTATSALSLQGYFYCYGIAFNCGTGAGTSTLTFGAALSDQVYEACSLNLKGTSASSLLSQGTSGGSGSQETRLINSTVSFGATGQSLVVNNSRFSWSNTPSAIQGATLPTTLFTSSNPGGGSVRVMGVDLSALGSGKTLVGSIVRPQIYQFLDCELGASVTVSPTGAGTTQGGGRVDVINSDSGATSYRCETYQYQGTLTTETTIIRSGGSPQSWKVVTTANNKRYMPFECFENTVYAVAGTPITVYLNCITDLAVDATALTNADIWMEAQVLDNASFPISDLYTTAPANQLTAGTTLTSGTSSGSWTTTGMTTPDARTASLTFTPQIAGDIRVTVKVGRASLSTLRVDFNPAV